MDQKVQNQSPARLPLPLRTGTMREFDGRKIALGMNVITVIHDERGDEVAAPARCVRIRADDVPLFLIDGAPSGIVELRYVDAVHRLDHGTWCWPPRV